jgi:DHA1 family tetracycline resistance protein-like MFS transporter
MNVQALRADARLATLFGIVLVDLLGFGMLIPLTPFYVKRLGASPEMITFIVALYSLAQFFAGPWIGRLSDTYGRRPVLVVSLGGHVVSYVMLAFADSIFMMGLSRVIGGIAAANMATAFAYVTDITPPQERAKNIGIVSSAIGIGFIFGPSLGGFLAGSAVSIEANLMRPALAAASFSALAMLAAFLFLPESLPKEKRHADGAGRPPFWRAIVEVTQLPSLRLMFFLSLIGTVAIGMRDAILPLFAADALALTMIELGVLITYAGIVSTLMQAFGIGRLTARFGEARLVRAGIILLGVAFVILSVAPHWSFIALAMTFGACGMPLFNTCLQSLVSRQASPQERGIVMGTYQSMGSLGRFVGPVAAGVMYGQIAINAAFVGGAVMAAIAAAMAFKVAQPKEAGPATPARAAGH